MASRSIYMKNSKTPLIGTTYHDNNPRQKYFYVPSPGSWSYATACIFAFLVFLNQDSLSGRYKFFSGLPFFITTIRRKEGIRRPVASHV